MNRPFGFLAPWLAMSFMPVLCLASPHAMTGGGHQNAGSVNLTLIPLSGPVQPDDPDLAFLFTAVNQSAKVSQAANATAAGASSATRPVTTAPAAPTVAEVQRMNRAQDMRVAMRTTPMPSPAQAPR